MWACKCDFANHCSAAGQRHFLPRPNQLISCGSDCRVEGSASQSPATFLRDKGGGPVRKMVQAVSLAAIIGAK